MMLWPSLADFFVREIHEEGQAREFQIINRKTCMVEAVRKTEIAAAALAERMQAELERYRAALRQKPAPQQP